MNRSLPKNKVERPLHQLLQTIPPPVVVVFTHFVFVHDSWRSRREQITDRFELGSTRMTSNPGDKRGMMEIQLSQRAAANRVDRRLRKSPAYNKTNETVEFIQVLK